MRPKWGGKKRFQKKKKRSAPSDFVDEETGETGETGEFTEEVSFSWPPKQECPKIDHLY